MAVKPDHGVCGRWNRWPRRNEGALDHNDGKAKRARGLDLGNRSLASRIFRQNRFDAALAKQENIVLRCERPACPDYDDARQAERCCRRVDQPDDVGMLRRGLKLSKSEAANGAEDRARFLAERRNRRSHIRNDGPVVFRLTFPGGPFDGEERRTGDRSRGDGVSAHLGREWVGCVDEDIDLPVPQIADKPLNPAKAAASHRNGLGARSRCPSGKGESCLETAVPGEQPCERARFRGASEEKNEHGSRY